MAHRRIETRLLLVVDQLEGLFGTPGQKAFAKVLRALVDGGRATLCSDRYTDLQFDRDLLTLKRAGATYDLPPPGPAEIADIVKGPARAAGLALSWPMAPKCRRTPWRIGSRAWKRLALLSAWMPTLRGKEAA